MGLIERIKAALGLTTRERTRSRTPRGRESTGDDVSVTVEREPDTATEDAVKGTGSTTSSNEAGTGAAPASETTRQESPAESTQPTGTAAGDAEPDEAASSDADTAQQEDDGDATAEDTGAAEPATAGGADEHAAEDDGTDVQTIKGIGPAYAERLAEADIETVADLAAADAETVAAETGIAESRVAGWIERAGE